MQLKRFITITALIAFIVLPVASFSQTPKEFSKLRTKWLYRVKKDTKKLPLLYLKQAMLVRPDQHVFGQDAIRLFVEDNPGLFAGYNGTESLHLFEHSDRKVLDIGYLLHQDARKKVLDRLLYVVAWRKIDDIWLRELDIFLPAETAEFVPDDMAETRAEWINLANGRDPHALAESIFLHDAVYLNNSEASTGHAAIAQRFDFIRNPAFSINLKNEKLCRLDDTTAIDIGNWKTDDFVGYYLILWKKDEAGEWKISLYFNY